MYPFLSNIIKFNTISILGVFKTEEGDAYNLLTVRKKGNKLTVLSISSFQHIDDLIKNSNLKLPIILVIDGKGVLIKSIDLHNEADTAWKKNIDYNTIYLTEFNVQGYSLMSFSRKAPIDALITELGQKGFQIVDFYLGPLPAALLEPVIKKDSFLANDTSLAFNKNVLAGFSKKKPGTDETFQFEDKQLSNYHLPLYGAAIHYFLKNTEISKSVPENIRQDEIVYKKAFTSFGTGVLVTFLFSLLISYFLIQYYTAKNLDLNQQNVYLNQTYQYIIDLEKQKEQKLAILSETGQLSKNFISYYSYELLNSVPESLQINNLAVFPLAKEVKANNKVEIEAGIIFLKGTTATEWVFNEWLSKLKKMNWIKKFEILSLKIDKKNVQQFEIKIYL